MTTAGWIIMVLSVGTVTSLLAFCFYRVLCKPSSTDHMHSPIDIDTHDLDT